MWSTLVSLMLAAAAFTTAVHADLASTIAQVKPAIAIVGTYKATNNPRFTMRGTGFVVATGQEDQSNLIITNAHVLQQPETADTDADLVVQIRMPGTGLQMRAVKVLEVDTLHDLSLLRLDGSPVAAFKVRDSASVQEGKSVAFMGFPIGGALGFSPVTHRATVSSITLASLPPPTAGQLHAQSIRRLRNESPFSLFQLDGTAYPGNSGGPLFDPDNGDVLGVINMVLLKATHESALTHPSGISYAIPSRFVLDLLRRHLGAMQQ